MKRAFCFLSFTLLLITVSVVLFNSCKKDEPKKDPVITWLNPVDIRSGTALSATQLNATSDVTGTFVYTPAAGTKLNEGLNQELKVEFTPTDASRYNKAGKTVKINVIPKNNPVITWENPADIYYGTSLSTTQLNATTDVPGILIYTPAIGTKLNAGANQDIRADFKPNDSIQYNATSKIVKINVIPKIDPVLTWANPKDIIVGAILTSKQCNAAADVPGKFVYTPKMGTKLPLGLAQNLKVVFTPNDTITFNFATITVQINVIELTTVTDIQGNVYRTVKIGKQEWMAENLKATKFNDNSDIPMVTDNAAWSLLATPAYCWYKNLSELKPYGALYNWYAVNSGKLAPAGWHIPTDAEWDTLVQFLGGKAIAGGKLKEQGMSHWLADNIGATDEFAFTGVPAGCRRYTGVYNYQTTNGYMWSSTPSDQKDSSWGWGISYGDDSADRISYKNTFGFSIRCVKD